MKVQPSSIIQIKYWCTRSSDNGLWRLIFLTNLRLLFSPPLQFCCFCNKILFYFLESIFFVFSRNLSVSTGSLEMENLHLSFLASLFWSNKWCKRRKHFVPAPVIMQNGVQLLCIPMDSAAFFSVLFSSQEGVFNSWYSPEDCSGWSHPMICTLF